MPDLASEAIQTADGMLLSITLAELAKLALDPAALLREVRSAISDSVDGMAFDDDPTRGEVLKHAVLHRVESVMRAADSLAGPNGGRR